MKTFADTLDEARGLEFDYATMKLRVSRKSASITVRFWRKAFDSTLHCESAVTVLKVFVTTEPSRIAGESLRRRLAREFVEAFPDKYVSV